MSSIDVSIRGIDELRARIEKAGRNPDEFFGHCARELAVVLLRRTMQKTPRDTSNLVRRWTDHESSPESRAADVSAEQWAETVEIARQGSCYEITISNPTEYALMI